MQLLRTVVIYSFSLKVCKLHFDISFNKPCNHEQTFPSFVDVFYFPKKFITENVSVQQDEDLYNIPFKYGQNVDFYFFKYSSTSQFS